MTLLDRAEPSDAVSDDVYRRVRADIVFGRMAPGHKLRLDALKIGYEASISTLREVLNRLTAEGLVAAEGRKGFEVAAVSAQDLRELAELRLLLETHAMRISFERGDVEWEGRIVSAHHKLASIERLMEKEIGQLEQWKRYDSEFHQALISSCGSRALMESYRNVFDRYFRYQMLAFDYRGAEPAQQHKLLLEAALARDIAGATSVLTAHVNDCVAHTLENASLT